MCVYVCEFAVYIGACMCDSVCVSCFNNSSGGGGGHGYLWGNSYTGDRHENVMEEEKELHD